MDDGLRKMLNITSAPDGSKGACKLMVDLGDAVFVGDSNDLKLRQMVVLRAVKVLGGPDHIQASMTMSCDDGLTPEEIEVTVGDGPITGAPPDCALVCAAVDEILVVGTLTHATLHGMQARFGLTTIRKLVSIVGWFAAVSLLLDDCRVPMLTDGRTDATRSPHD